MLNKKSRFSALILLVSIIAVSRNAFCAYAGSTVYDLISHAPDASWSSGAGVLPFPGNPADNRGFALFVDNAFLEDGSTWQRVLETHPQWVGGGWIMGAYPQQTVQSNVQLIVRIEFLSGATGTDGARFDVYFDEYRGLNVAPLRHTILSQVATLDDRLDLVTKDLDYLAGKKGNFIIYVNAGQTSGRDWAVWAEARVETKALPDLVIAEVRCDRNNSLIGVIDAPEPTHFLTKFHRYFNGYARHCCHSIACARLLQLECFEKVAT